MTANNHDIKIALDIYYAIIYIRKIQHLKPSTEKIHSYLKKIDKDLQYESFSKIMDQLVQKEFINIQGDGNEESIFVNKSVSDFLRTFNLETKNCETQTDQVKEDCNEHKNKEQDTGKKELENFLDNIDLNASPVKPDNTHILYERLITNLQSDVLFLREQLKARDVYFKEEITYLRNQLDDCLRCFHCLSKTENNTSIHKSKPNSLANYSAPESTEKQKDDTFKKNYIDVNKKDSSNGSNQVVTTDKSIQQPENGKQAPKEKEKSGNSNNEKQTKKKKIYILGDSMIKHLKGYDISAKLKQRHNIYVRPFTGAKVRSMKDYAKSCIREENPDHIILHVGTNDLISENNAERVTISGIIPRNDHWNIKAEEVNNHMKGMCASAKIDYIDNFQNFNPRRHLNNSRLHLNDKGSYKLNNIFVVYLYIQAQSFLGIH